MNEPEACPVAMESEGGAVRAALSSDIEIVASTGAGLVSVTLQALLAPEERTEGVHTTEEIVGGETRLTVACEEPLNVAVRVAV